MTLLYKLTTPEHTTLNNTLWGENVEHTASGIGELCSTAFLHAYTHPLLAVLLNPIHADISSPVLWECDGNVIKNDRGLKVGCDRLKTIRIIPLPEITIAQKIAFGILCAKEVTTDTKWHEWANKWLSGEDRTTKAAYAACADFAAAAARRAADRAAPIDLIAIAEKAMTF